LVLVYQYFKVISVDGANQVGKGENTVFPCIFCDPNQKLMRARMFVLYGDTV